MKNLLNLSAVVLLFLVMGCGCPQFRNLGKKDPPPPPPPAPSNAPPPAAPTPRGGQTSALTMAQYNQLKIGMKRSEVERILGGPGEEISSTSGGGVNFSVNKWSGESYTSVIISFRDDKIMSKSQVGLK
ncbi:MAG: hypothetical protein HOP17_08180 [Acidobacteria bacterium]|nr:hypothetical protein [Acidobacteriota bacterium]